MAKRMLAVAAAVLVAAALGVGGVLVASRSGQREPAVLAGLQVEGDQGAGSAASAQAAPRQPQSPTVPPASQAVPGGPPRYQVRGQLPELPRSARAWTLDERASGSGPAAVAALARELGLAGQPKQEELDWTVGDGTRQLRVSRVPGLPWSFGSFPLGCGGPMPDGVSPKARGMACATIAPEIPRAPSAPLQLPDRAQAERAARELLGRVGVRLDGLELQLTRGVDRWFALASPRVGGLPTSGFSWSVGIGPKGQVVSASGWLATPRPGDSYPLITVQQALERLRQRQIPGPITVTGPPQPLPSPLRPDCRRGDEAKGCPTPQVPTTLTVTGVRLGLQLASVLPQSGSGQRVDYLVPAYFFQLEGSWARQATVVAVQDRFLTAPTPTAVPLRTR